MIDIPSPAIAIVGRHNSGKTTLIERLIAELVARGLDVGSIKHHSHRGFDIDHPGKDSYRHRAAGASETVIAAPGQVARVKTIEGEMECSDLVRSMPGHDIVVVEGYRKSGLPTIEIMRQANAADAHTAEVLLAAARAGEPLGADHVQLGRAEEEVQDEGPFSADEREKMPTAATVAVATDIPAAREAAALYGIPAIGLEDTAALADFLTEHYVRPRVSVVIQAGGESRRMGRSKATVPFAGRPLICRLVERLAPVADELIITTNEAPNLEFLHEMYPDRDIRLVPDAYNERGALPGLYTALSAARNPYVAVVACDMVFASARLVVAEALAMHESGADVVTPHNKHGFEPLHAMYRRDTCAPVVHRRTETGEKRVQSFFSDPEITVLPFAQERVLEVEPRGGCFINANTPEDLARIEESYLGE
ncbi:molybdopterin-guanine dinucleotide biosynthesis protein B [Adlercreutzia caecimuris]|jgi:molybdopterin-guanine dinucleotide biosynthesis protein|uniref:molybdopterin-guanine dinucleotide biosynthesis protein B n=1 Tax=Adlercreutzia caecimuris TaxID=671266 RepID=UPI0013649AE6|nr:molybdopterin-guanine dinucleotide biosynthesis protein B [Adlercreutzia caecimuris]MCI9207191.1 molybdopterin-guanine dinucleotide biosynthesis protein B [Adlercreutzia caecimuris]MCR2037053.1 molybdopterin-guanine dinucleotide biosynthesis protein B [Adlercreutzia caecimuris]NBJ66592.1 molybdopterin-guanine dinucleotide biosynthesis protein B [Adlercreutzia caecimuris]